jgi:sialic acid synthase SpsE
MFVISEISPQFHGNIAIAEQMILQSKLAGADAVKVQLYGESDFGIERAYLSMKYDQLKHLKEFSDRLNMPFFATAFDEERLEWCIDLDFPYLKVAARMHKESQDLIEKIISKNKPLFISVSSDFPVEKVVKVKNAVYLYCVSKYPTRLDEFTLPNFHNSLFNGISDHSIGMAGAVYAGAHGAKYLEKHFTLHIGDQRITEQAHVGAMTVDDLKLIKTLTSQFELIPTVN